MCHVSGHKCKSIREEPTIHDRVERSGAWDPADILRGFHILGGDVYRVVISRGRNGPFFYLFARPATNCQPAKTPRNCHLPGSSLAEQLPPTLGATYHHPSNQPAHRDAS